MAADHNGAYYNSSQSCDSCHTGSPQWPGDVDCARCHDPADTVPDLIAPSTSSDAEPSYTGDVTIHLDAVDNPGGQGVDRTYFILDGESPVEGTAVSVAAPASGSQTHTLQYYSVDKAGNTESAKPVPALSFTVVAGPDVTAPSGTMSVNGGEEFTGSVTATVDSDVSDAGSGMHEMRIDPGTGTYASWMPYSESSPLELPEGDGEKMVRVAYSDNENNIATLTDTITLDTTPPATTSDAMASYAGMATVELTATDGIGGSGVAETRFRVDSGPEQIGTLVTVAPPASGTESHTLYFWSVDQVTNTEVEKSTSFSVEAAVLDTTPPTTISSFDPVAGAVYNTPQSVTLSATDAGGSGVDATYYRIDADSYVQGASFSVATDGLHTFSYYSADSADNTETVNVSNEFRIDTIAPVTTSDITEGFPYDGAQTFMLTPTDTSGSGVAETWWQLDSTTGPWTSGTLIPVTAPVSGSASHTLYWYSSDSAGNPELVQSATFSVSASGSQSTLAFRWEPEGYGYARLRLYNAAMQEIDSMDITGTDVPLNWYVPVEPGLDYYLEVHEATDGNWIEVDYGIWSNDTALNPDGILSPGETVTWWY